MCKFYRLELADYSAPPWNTTTKAYYGSMDDFRMFFDVLSVWNRSRGTCSNLIEAFRSYENGQMDTASSKPLLTPVNVLYWENAEHKDIMWSHKNVWGCDYTMKCSQVNTSHLWIEYDGHRERVLRAEFEQLCYKGFFGEWIPVGRRLWGFPCVLAGDSMRFWNRLLELEFCFDSEENLQQNWRSFKKTHDVNFGSFMDDIFGDG